MRGEEEDLYVSYDYQHEPSESDAGVHVAQERIPLENLHMQEAVADNVADVFEQYFRIEEGEEKLPPVLGRQLQNQPYEGDKQVDEDENHPGHEWYHKIVIP